MFLFVQETERRRTGSALAVHSGIPEVGGKFAPEGIFHNLYPENFWPPHPFCKLIACNQRYRHRIQYVLRENSRNLSGDFSKNEIRRHIFVSPGFSSRDFSDMHPKYQQRFSSA